MSGAIVLLHGVASNRSRWSEFAATTALREAWALLAPDLRGNGDFVYRGRIGMAEWCADIAALLDAKGHSRAIVIGHCLGANIALNFAARFPQRVHGLVLIEPMPPDALIGTMREVKRLRPLLHVLIPIVRALNALGISRRQLAPLDLEILDRETRAALARGPQGEAQLAKYASPLLDLRTTATGAYLQALLAVTEELPAPERIPAPVLALVSERSTFTDAGLTRAYLERLSDCETVALPAKHWIPTEQPQAMRDVIESWVGRRFASTSG
ncbi:MAG: alpha/beta hydrolase [Betaproteobacteria bacterium]|nr:MAG: alpha/beta hydrolase [Betaproteobacteria bacterium]